MGKRSKSVRKYGKNTHHIFCKSTYPHLRHESWNKVVVGVHEHDLYHQLFGNRTPKQIIQYLMEHFWNGITTPLTGGIQDVVKRIRQNQTS